MAASINSGFSNNFNVVTVRAEGVNVHRYTDRAITSPAFDPRAKTSNTVETDRGVNTTGTIGTTGVS